MALPLRYNVLSLWARPTSTISSILLIALIIGTFAYLQAVTDSAFGTLKASGDTNTVIVISQAAESETVSRLTNDELNKLSLTPGVVRAGDQPLISREAVTICSAFTADGSDVPCNVAVRGVYWDDAIATRHGRVRIIAGQTFQPGAYEVVVGKAAARLYKNMEVGGEVQLGSRGMRMFKVVGVFDAGGTAADSEVWTYVETLKDVYGRASYSSGRMIVAGQQGADEAIGYISGPAVELAAKTERAYFSGLNSNQYATYVLSIAMIVIMGIAAAFAVANTMFASVAGRVREIGMLRAVGFAPTNILTAFLLEGLMIALAGGLLGAALSFLANGAQKNMLPSTFTTVTYELAITPKIIGTSLLVALVIGLFGSIMPAWRAARMQVVTALRD